MTVERFVLVALLLVVFGWGARRIVRWSRRRRLRYGAGRDVDASGWTATRGGTLPADEPLTIAAWAILEARPANPLAILGDLAFEEAIDVRRYGDAVARFQEREQQRELTIAGTVVSVATNVRDLAKAGSQLTFEVTSSIRAGLARGTLRLVRDRDGKLLASVQDARTGKITNLLRGAPSGARLGALTATVYGLAHLVSAQDLATKLDVVSGKLDLLLAFRSIDQRARLEAAYARAKELGSLPLDALGAQELRGLRQEVRELRYVWRAEVMHALERLRDPHPVKRFNARVPWIRASHAVMYDGLREAVGRVALMEFSLRFEHLLAVASDDAEPFLRALPDELNAWDELGDLVDAKARKIGFAELSAEPYVAAVREVVEVYRRGVDGVLASVETADALPEAEVPGDAVIEDGPLQR